MTGATIDRPARRRLGVGAAIVLVLVAAAAAVLVGVVRGGSASDASGEVVLAPTAAVDLAVVYVHVSGAVAHPGVFRLQDGARVVDGIAAAGGLAPGADPAAVNLARLLTDGEQLRIPLVGEAPVAGAGGADGAGPAGVAPDGRVNLNTADATALDTLPRVGPAIAERIIAWREANGAFTSVDDLLAVPGIGEKLLAGLRDRVTV